MSGGHVHIPTWRDELTPLLEDRIRAGFPALSGCSGSGQPAVVAAIPPGPVAGCALRTVNGARDWPRSTGDAACDEQSWKERIWPSPSDMRRSRESDWADGRAWWRGHRSWRCEALCEFTSVACALIPEAAV